MAFTGNVHSLFDVADINPGSQTTSGATPVEIYRQTIQPGEHRAFRVEILAERLADTAGGTTNAGADRASYVREFSVYRTSSGAAAFGRTAEATATDYESAAGLDVTVATDTNDVVISVTGVAAQRFAWAMIGRTFSVAGI